MVAPSFGAVAARPSSPAASSVSYGPSCPSRPGRPACRTDRVVGAWELWWEDEDAWGPQPPTAGYVHRLMVDHSSVPPGTGLQLLRVAERRVAEAGLPLVRLDCLAGNERLNAYYLNAGYQVAGRKEGKPQPGGTPKSFTLLEKSMRDSGA
ncbi:GNAT family N-acetyltransferase [Streptomyces chiangmaiensis]